MADAMHPVNIFLLLAGLSIGGFLALRVFWRRWQRRQRSLDGVPATRPEEVVSPDSFETCRQNILDACTDCGACVKQCAFLTAHGTPRSLLLGMDSTSTPSEGCAFECSLCGLCAAVCPQELDPRQLFLEMRRRQVQRGRLQYRRYRSQLLHEQWGSSSLLSWYGLPAGCTTVFFPGCGFPGTRPAITLRMFADLRRTIPSLGMVLDCCMKPSHDLGRAARFQTSFAAMHRFLAERGVRSVVTACPNCTMIFRQYAPEMTVQLAYDVLEEGRLTVASRVGGEVSVHDPCPLRDDRRSQTAVRGLLARMGYDVVDLPHQGRQTICCGEGGSVPAVRPDFSSHWTRLRQREADGRTLVTSCAGCARFLGRLTPTIHVADLLYQDESRQRRWLASSWTPCTYWNRYLLKRSLQKIVSTTVPGTRPKVA